MRVSSSRFLRNRDHSGRRFSASPVHGRCRISFTHVSERASEFAGFGSLRLRLEVLGLGVWGLGSGA